MLSKEDKSKYLSDLFRHLDGLVTIPTMDCLDRHGVLKYILEKEQASVTSIARAFKANEGYLNVALRVLASQGWLHYQLDHSNNDVIYRIQEQSSEVFAWASCYRQSAEYIRLSAMPSAKKFDIGQIQHWKHIAELYDQGYQLPTNTSTAQQMLHHIEGVLIAPTAVKLGMSGMFHKYFMEASFTPEEFHQDPETFRIILDFLAKQGWFETRKNTYQFTEKGLFFAKRASAYGVTVSYLPTLAALDELIFGNPRILQSAPHETEKHVDREMNVWGSGGAHATYFHVMDEIIIELFNRPIEQQPKGILDMGCGNGALLEHLFTVIERQTLRGKLLEEHPLILVGADYNEAALRVTRANLIKADIWAKVIFGDIGNPEMLATSLREGYSIELTDLLNVRTFLDHNRIWQEPTQNAWNSPSTSTGAYASRGERISNNRVEASLHEHLSRWQPYVQRFGLLVIELHTLAPAITAANLGKTAATAYDATHGYSDQYIVEIDVFEKIATQAGLTPVPQYTRKFPNSELATVSIHLLKQGE